MAKFFTPTRISENIRKTPEGFLLCLGVPVARTGWQVYGEGETPLKTKDGKIKIYRDKKEVFHPKTIASFQGKPVTITHPENFVSPENWKILAKGSGLNVRKAAEKDDDGEECLLADLLITDEMTIELVRNGLREISCGYEAEYEQTGDGEGRQINIVGNHFALVEEGRAGSSYAIRDHKGEQDMSVKLIDRLKKKFGAKVVDEAMAKEEGEKKVTDADAAYDELVKAAKDLMTRVEGLKTIDKEEEKEESKDEDKEEKKEESKDDDDDKAKDEFGEKKEESKDKEENETEMEISERVKSLEAAVAKILEHMTGESKDEEKEEKEESKDGEEEEESEDAKDDDFEESSLTGDMAARIEILAPGLKLSKKDNAKKQALTAAFATKDGREVIQSLTGSKKLVLSDDEKVSMLFTAASEILKARRGNGLEKTKDVNSFDAGISFSEPMTAEKMNELNAAHWAARK